MCAIQVLGLAPLITHRLVFTGDVHVTQFQGKFYLRKNTIIYFFAPGSYRSSVTDAIYVGYSADSGFHLLDILSSGRVLCLC